VLLLQQSSICAAVMLQAPTCAAVMRPVLECMCGLFYVSKHQLGSGASGLLCVEVARGWARAEVGDLLPGEQGVCSRSARCTAGVVDVKDCCGRFRLSLCTSCCSACLDDIL
jgi:hypothetical protein